MRKLLNILLSFLFGLNIFASQIKVTNVSEFNQALKIVVPGDSIILANGVWNNAGLYFIGNGTIEQPITLTAETEGKVTLEGQSFLRLSGEFLNVSGMVFINGYTPEKFVIDFRGADKKYANNCKVSRCVVDYYNQPRMDIQDTWVSMRGKNNVVEYCYFAGKNNQGTTFIVWPDDSLSINNNHHIYRNYFGVRPNLGNNGGETIRIGTSYVSQNVSATVVEENYFERCNGEVEIISIKSCENKILRNTFFECEGAVTNRHGHRNHIEGNLFWGNNKPATGGVRVINEGHVIVNNLFYQLAGSDFRTSLSILNGIPNSPDNGYYQVKDVLISNNTFWDCSNPWLFNGGFGSRDRTEVPKNTTISNNLIYSSKQKEIVDVLDDASGIKLSNNVAWLNGELIQKEGFVASEFDSVSFAGWQIPVPTVQSDKIVTATDFNNVGRFGGNLVGAFASAKSRSDRFVASAKYCGPEWYTPIVTDDKIELSSDVYVVKDEKGALLKALKKAKNGDILELEEGVHILSKRLSINKIITIRAKKEATVKPIIKSEEINSTVYLFELLNNSYLKLEGIALDGNDKSESPAKYGFTTGKAGNVRYSLKIENCEMYGFNRTDGGSIFKTYPGSFADSIIVRSSIIRDSYRGFALNAEKDSPGKYSAENVIFYNTLFNSITQYALDYNRIGLDESSLGGNLVIDHCVFDNVYSTSNKIMVITKGIVNVNVTNSIFLYSMAKRPIYLVGSKQSISHCNVFRAGIIEAKVGATATSIYEGNPSFIKKTYKLGPKSKLIKAGLNGENIGLLD